MAKGSPDEASDIRLRAERLGKRFGRRQVLEDCSIEVKPRSIVGLLGPNGAGKTTCFYLIVGLLRADNGSIFLAERNITRAPMHVRARLGLGYLPQETSVFRGLSVADNVRAILELRRDLGREDRERLLQELLTELGIDRLRDQRGISLSGGELRRVEIARALAADPRYMLLDEPFAGVDPISVGDIQTIVKDLKQRGIGVLITDHQVRETLGICDYAYILAQGKVLAKGTPKQIVANRKVRTAYLGADFRL